MSSKKFLFVVQAEGRGHLTQAIAVYEMLTRSGHIVTAVVIGSAKGKEVPAYVKERCKVPVLSIDSPHFVKDKHNRGISITRSIVYAIKNIRKYYQSICFLKEAVHHHQPDVIINFYEPLTGIAAALFSLPVKIISVAHQYIYLHPDFHFPKGSSNRDQWLVKYYTKLTAYRSNRLLALSFYQMDCMDYRRIKICPPLLRKEIAQQEIFKGKYILVYLVNAGYMKNIISWHKENPDMEIHCFTDSPAVKGKWQYAEGLYFHALDDRKFLYYMANAAALATTAGFESVCEAMYMGKPVMMVPVENHFEQWCNARDAASCGAGIYANHFDLTQLKNYISKHVNVAEKMINWVDRAETILIQAIAELFVDESDFVPSAHTVEALEMR
jgi:uncharacterized protein (TIGR00661 family)